MDEIENLQRLNKNLRRNSRIRMFTIWLLLVVCGMGLYNNQRLIQTNQNLIEANDLLLAANKKLLAHGDDLTNAGKSLLKSQDRLKSQLKPLGFDLDEPEQSTRFFFDARPKREPIKEGNHDGDH